MDRIQNMTVTTFSRPALPLKMMDTKFTCINGCMKGDCKLCVRLPTQVQT